MFIDYYLPGKSDVTFQVLDVSGKVVMDKHWTSIEGGITTQRLELGDIAAGTYVFRMVSAGLVRSKKWIKN